MKIQITNWSCLLFIATVQKEMYSLFSESLKVTTCVNEIRTVSNMTYIDIFLFSKKRTLVFHPLPPSYVLYARENVENYGPPLIKKERNEIHVYE